MIYQAEVIIIMLTDVMEVKEVHSHSMLVCRKFLMAWSDRI